MGFSTAVKKKFNFIYKEKYDKTYGEYELDTVLVGEYSGPIKPDEREVAEYKWVKIDELKKDIKKNPNKFTPWFKILLKKLEI
jgi:isopentenyl-diphosphate delta-isomerase